LLALALATALRPLVFAIFALASFALLGLLGLVPLREQLQVPLQGEVGRKPVILGENEVRRQIRPRPTHSAVDFKVGCDVAALRLGGMVSGDLDSGGNALRVILEHVPQLVHQNGRGLPLRPTLAVSDNFRVHIDP
jgi:hypothetical protein